MKGPYGPAWEEFASQAARMAADLAAEATRHHHKHDHKHHHHKHHQGRRMRSEFGWIFGGQGPWGASAPPGAWTRQGWGKGGRGQRARKGNVRAAILALLAEEPRNGYQIIQDINERSGGAWKPSPGAVYPALQQLADEGLIQAEESGGGRKTFSLTDEGLTYVEEHADELSDPWDEMTPEFGVGVPELLKQAAQTGGALMQIVHTGSPEQVARAQQVLAEARRKLYRILADEDPDDAPDEED